MSDPVEDQIVIWFIHDGLTRQEIADKLACSKEHVGDVLRKRGASDYVKKKTLREQLVEKFGEGWLDAIEEMVNTYGSLAKVARMLEVNENNFGDVVARARSASLDNKRATIEEIHTKHRVRRVGPTLDDIEREYSWLRPTGKWEGRRQWYTPA